MVAPKLAFALLGIGAIAGEASGPLGALDRAVGSEERLAIVIPAALAVTGGSPVAVPIRFSWGEATISSVVFSLDLEEKWLSIDEADDDGDGIPDAVAFDVPSSFVVSAVYEPDDSDGEIDVVIADLSAPLEPLPEGVLVTLSLDTAKSQSMIEAEVGFSDTPSPSLGDTSGRSVAGSWLTGSVRIWPQLEVCFIPSVTVRD